MEPNAIEEFDGELLHPSLDIKNKVMLLGFRYRATAQEEKTIFVMAGDGVIKIIEDDSFKVGTQLYCLEKRIRQLARLEEKWSVPALRQFLKDYESMKPTATMAGVFEKIVTLAKRYIELERDIDYDILAAWIIGTYFSPAFNAYPFLHIKAPKRSGKSQCLNLLAQTSFNAIKARPSLAALGDTVDALRGTYLIDQADSLTRRGNEELLDILADSYKKSGGKRRVVNFDKKRGRETLEFETYAPKAFASIKELPEDLADRCLVVPLIRSQKNFPDPDDSNENWHEVRGELYQVLMTSHDIVASTYNIRRIAYRQSQELLGRSLELWLPFEVILECCGAVERIGDAKRRFLAQYGFTEYEPSELEQEVVKNVLTLLQDKPDAILTPKEIAELIDLDLFPARDTTLQQRAVRVGWAIKKFNLSSEKMSRTKDGVRYLFQKIKVEAILKSYLKGDTEPTSLTSPAPDTINLNEIAM